LCDVLGVPLAYTPDAGGTVAGAAILAGLGCGALDTPAVARRWRRASIRHQPSAANHRLYRELLTVRREAYAGLRPVFPKLAR
jgi:sugar (pentulose or hexulose) kinase